MSVGISPIHIPHFLTPETGDLSIRVPTFEGAVQLQTGLPSSALTSVLINLALQDERIGVTREDGLPLQVEIAGSISDDAVAARVPIFVEPVKEVAFVKVGITERSTLWMPEGETIGIIRPYGLTMLLQTISYYAGHKQEVARIRGKSVNNQTQLAIKK